MSHDHAHVGARHPVAVWSVLGVALILLDPIVRLGTRTWLTIGAGLTPLQWVALASTAACLIYLEGYRAFQLRLVPRVVTRAIALSSSPRRGHHALAPLHALSLIGAAPRTLARAWLGVGAIAAAVLVVRGLPHPWRGVIDAGVFAALVWGLVALLVRYAEVARRPRRTTGARQDSLVQLP